MNRDTLMAFFKLLESKLPRYGGHHSISFCRYGSDEKGWDDRLGLHVRISAFKTQTFFLEDEDLNKPIEQLVDEIVALVKEYEQI